MALDIHPVTPDRWDDVVALFGPNGAYSGCWCMWFRMSSREFDAESHDQRRAGLCALVEEGREPGLLAYDGDRPVGWLALAPREEYGRVLRSRDLQPPDDAAVTAITCLFIARDARKRGVGDALVAGAVEHARTGEVALLEAYPVDTSVSKRSAADLYHGTLSMFLRAGFTEVARRNPARPVVRRAL